LQGLTLTAALKSAKVTQGDGVTIHVTLRNDSAEDIKVWPSKLALVLATDSPFSSESIGYKHPENRDFWYYSYGYSPLDDVAGAQAKQIACHQIEVSAEENPIISLGPQKVFEEDFTVGKELLPDDYEIFAMLTPNNGSPLAEPMSRRLPFDVVAKADAAGAKGLDAEAATTVKQEVRQSMTGVRDTLVFYLFPEQQAVLCVRIGNADTTFPPQARIHTFAAGVTREGLEKWVNNQHSDGLFADAPESTADYEIPAARLKIQSHQHAGRSTQNGGDFDDYKVKFHIGDTAIGTLLQLKGFTGEALVHVKAH
jgi:hypothetical protein